MRCTCYLPLVLPDGDAVSEYHFTIEGHITPYTRMTQRSMWNARSQLYLASKEAIRVQYQAQMALHNWRCIGRQPIGVGIKLYGNIKQRKCDLDNQIKALLDAANDCVFDDDRWVDDIHALRFEDDEETVEVRVFTYDKATPADQGADSN